MNAVLILGRIALIVIFLFSGASKLLDITGTAGMIESQITIPPELMGVATQLQDATGMTTPQLLAIVVGVAEVLGALMIAVNFGTRVGAVILIAFTIAATFYFHDFWNQTGEMRSNNTTHALKNLSIIGGLLVMFALGSWRPAAYQGREEPPV